MENTPLFTEFNSSSYTGFTCYNEFFKLPINRKQKLHENYKNYEIFRPLQGERIGAWAWAWAQRNDINE